MRGIKYLLAAGFLYLGFAFTSIDQEKDLAQSMKRGEELYVSNCVSCHMADGTGVPSVFPPLANADYMMKDPARTVNLILNGMSGEIVVNGVTYSGVMSAYPFDDQQLADLMNYIQNSWGNKAEMLRAQDIAKMKK